MEIKKSYHCVYNIHYHFVFPVKYRKALLEEEIGIYFVKVCKEIQKRYQIEFERIGIDRDHVYILCSTVPRYSPSKSITARKIII